MSGLEVILLLGLLLGSGLGAALVGLWLSERSRRRFLGGLARALLEEQRAAPGLVAIEDVHRGDLTLPLRLTVLEELDTHERVRTRVTALLRGNATVWQFERAASVPVPGPVVIVERTWLAGARAARGLPVLEDVDTSDRLVALTAHSDAVRALLDVSHHALAAIWVGDGGETALGCTRQCVLEPDRILLELPRVGLSPDDVTAGLMRLQAVLDVVGGVPHATTRTTRARGQSESSPTGLPIAVPSLSG